MKEAEISPDKYVVITTRGAREPRPQEDGTIDIEDFVDLDEIDPSITSTPTTWFPTPVPRSHTSLLERASGIEQGRDRARRDPLEGIPDCDPAGGRRSHDGDDALRG